MDAPNVNLKLMAVGVHKASNWISECYSYRQQIVLPTCNLQKYIMHTL